MHEAQVTSKIGHAVGHIAADGAGRQAFVDLPVHDQRAAVLVDAATVLAGQRSTCGGTSLSNHMGGIDHVDKELFV